MDSQTPPTCEARPIPRPIHPHADASVRLDPYSWMDKGKGDNVELVAYLEAENDYCDNMFRSTSMGALKESLYAEFLSRMQETDESVPYRHGPYSYYSRTVEGLQYRIYCRKPVDCGGALGEEQVILDVNALAGDAEYCSVGVFEVSPSHNLLAYGVDFEGDEKYTIHIADISDTHLLSQVSNERSKDGDEAACHTGILPKHVYDSLLHKVADDLVWSSDDSHIFYVTLDKAQRPYRLYRHCLATSSLTKEDIVRVSGDDDVQSGANDSVLIYEEKDEMFNLCVDQTRDERFIVLSLASSVTTEDWLLPSDQPTVDFRVVQKRKQDVDYSVEVHGDTIFILTNADGAKNGKIMTASLSESMVGASGPMFDSSADDKLSEYLAHDKEVRLNGVMPFKNFVVLPQRKEGLPQLQIVAVPSDRGASSMGETHFVSPSEPAYDCYTSSNYEFDTEELRFVYTSFVTPRSTFQYDMATRKRTLMKEQPVLGGYDRSLYEVERLHTLADDGTKVPISLVRRRDAPKDGSAPCLLYGYGSYEITYDPAFSSNALSLLDRGVTFAIAHVRGGGEMGRYWYEDGKFQKKKNTFTDFLSCCKFLVDNKYTSSDRLAVYGASAGGLLMGAVLNMAGNTAFCAAVARVPFVDVMSTLLDKDLPLTIPEWEEWGNPFEDRAAYDYILSYSPYDHVSEQDYPHLFIKGGLNDPRVAVHEPAKWCAMLRQKKTDKNMLIMKTTMGAGHFGPSGRYEHLKSSAEEYAFVLDRLGFSE